MEPRKTYRGWDPEACAQKPFTPAEALPRNDLVFFLIELIPKLDLGPFYAYYESETRGAPPYDVAMMVTLLVYSYCVGVFSSRKIAAACERNLAFLAIVGDKAPNFRTISDFRKIHLDRFTDLFVEVLRVAAELGMIQLGNLSLDGSKIRANASRHKAMSYGYMEKEVERLRSEIVALLQQAEQTDSEQDATLGSRRGDELPAELERREQRLQAIEEAMRRLEQQAKEEAEAKRRERAEAQAEREAAGKKPRGPEPKPISDAPAERAQTNFTDPEAKVVKTSNKGFDYCYNAQAVVDEAHQIIIAAETSAAANDKQQAVPMADATLANLERAGIERPLAAAQTEDQENQSTRQPKSIPLNADNGYYSDANVSGLEARGFDPHIATGRQKHNQPVTPAPSSEASKEPTVKERMTNKLRTEAGRACYAKRKCVVEPVFGQVKHGRGFRQFLLRGLRKVAAEWKLVCLTHNLLKIWRHQYALT